IQKLSEPPEEELLPTTLPTSQPQYESKLSLAFKQFASSTRSVLVAAGLVVVNGMTQVVLSVFLTFFVFRDGDALGERVKSAIAGVPGAALLGLLTFFLSVLPVGPPLIWIPATIWLFSTSGTAWGVFMLIWGLCVSSIDNVLKPWLISQGAQMPFIVIFFGVL